MAGYVKLFSKILDSTIWIEDSDTRILWVTMLAMADRDGVVESTIPGLARRAQISLEKTESALQKFQEPDKYSWTPDQEGRRVERIDRGWALINYEKYREMLDADEVREKNRLRQERHRQRKRNVTKRDSNALSHDVTPVTKNNDMQYAPAPATPKANTKVKTSEGVAPDSSEENQNRPPEGLHSLNYATKLLEKLVIPSTPINLKTIAACIDAEIKSGKTGPSAYEFILAGCQDARDEGYELTTFFFNDARYRTENRHANGHGKSNSLAERNKRAFDEAMGRTPKQN